MQSDQQRAIWAVILSGIVLFLWQYFFVPQISPTQPATQVQKTVTTTSSDPSKVNLEVPKPADNQIFKLKNGNFEVEISNALSVKKITAVNSLEKLENVIGKNADVSLNFYSPDKSLLTGFNITSSSEDSISVFHADGVNIILKLDSSGKLLITGQFPKGYGYGLSGRSEAIDSTIQPRSYIYHVNKLHTSKVGDDNEDSGIMKWVGIDYAYHFLGLVNKDAPATDLSFNSQGYFQTKSFPLNNNLDSYVIFVKKEYDFLKSLGDSLHLTVDFGMFAFLAVPMLWLLKFFHGLVANFGWAIVLLTLLIRLLTFPLQWSSLKGMKKMQTLQPQLAKLKEKYKDDPMAMQKETMEIFKKSGVNPLSGCFPLLLQMPIFFALYSVLYNAVELVGADFVGWIHDLSTKDPYYILPIAMAVAMFVQQKITPTTITDKMQQRIFLFMPLIFGFFMKDLPSGLSLYIFVSTIAGILQQIFVFSRIK
jgi:YidC/Oxa1 family membrane protein insertase